jgi:hypothetical protein
MEKSWSNRKKIEVRDAVQEALYDVGIQFLTHAVRVEISNTVRTVVSNTYEYHWTY